MSAQPERVPSCRAGTRTPSSAATSRRIGAQDVDTGRVLATHEHPMGLGIRDREFGGYVERDGRSVERLDELEATFIGQGPANRRFAGYPSLHQEARRRRTASRCRAQAGWAASGHPPDPAAPKAHPAPDLHSTWVTPRCCAAAGLRRRGALARRPPRVPLDSHHPARPGVAGQPALPVKGAEEEEPLARESRGRACGCLLATLLPPPPPVALSPPGRSIGSLGV